MVGGGRQADIGNTQMALTLQPSIRLSSSSAQIDREIKSFNLMGSMGRGIVITLPWQIYHTCVVLCEGVCVLCVVSL